MTNENTGAQQAPNPNLTLTLTLQEVNVIIGALQEAPYRVSDPVLKSLIPQAEKQIKLFQQQG